MPDEPDSSSPSSDRPLPGPSPSPRDSSEDDLWDLDDDTPISTPAPQEARSRPETPEPGPVSVSREPDQKSEDSPPSPAAGGRIAAQPRHKRGESAPVPVISASPSPKRAPEKVSRPETTQSTPPRETEPAPPRPEAPKRKEKKAEGPDRSLGRGEKLGMAFLALMVLAIIGWAAMGLFSGVTTARFGDDLPDFPIEGEFAGVLGAESFWREPIRTGELRDRTRNDVVVLPVMSIQLDEGQSGAIRVTFRDDLGDSIGDTITRAFANGRFDQSGEDTIEISATDGFDDQANFNGYRVGGKRWTVEVVEGPSASASGRDFKPLFTLPLSSNRR